MGGRDARRRGRRRPSSYAEPIERVVILGSAGAGKSALATRIARRTGLPVVHLDTLFWRADWTPAPRDEARRALAAAAAGDRWILDGNFLDESGDDDARFARADTVVFLDMRRPTCMWRVLKRRVLDRGRRRPDLPAGAEEGLDAELLRWIWRYPRTDRPRVLDLVRRVGGRGAVHHLRSHADVRRFLDGLSHASAGVSRRGSRPADVESRARRE